MHMIVVVGDHGEGLGEHHENTHGIFLYDSTTHVPLIVKLPVKLPGRGNPGKAVDAQVRTIDILPTVTELLRIPPPEVWTAHRCNLISRRRKRHRKQRPYCHRRN